MSLKRARIKLGKETGEKKCLNRKGFGMSRNRVQTVLVVVLMKSKTFYFLSKRRWKVSLKLGPNPIKLRFPYPRMYVRNIKGYLKFKSGVRMFFIYFRGT